MYLWTLLSTYLMTLNMYQSFIYTLANSMYLCSLLPTDLLTLYIYASFYLQTCWLYICADFILKRNECQILKTNIYCFCENLCKGPTLSEKKWGPHLQTNDAKCKEAGFSNINNFFFGYCCVTCKCSIDGDNYEKSCSAIWCSKKPSLNFRLLQNCLPWREIALFHIYWCGRYKGHVRCLRRIRVVNSSSCG